MALPADCARSSQESQSKTSRFAGSENWRAILQNRPLCSADHFLFAPVAFGARPGRADEFERLFGQPLYGAKIVRYLV